MELTNPAPFIKQVLRRLELLGVRRYASQLDVDKRGQDHRGHILESGLASEVERERWQQQWPPYVVNSNSCRFIEENQ